jgi:DNA-binding NtrC family response regulator
MPATFERVFVIDDDTIIRSSLTRHLQAQGLTVLGLANVTQAIEEHRREPADLVISDLRLPDGSGMEVMEFVKKQTPGADVIIMTGFGSVENAVAAMTSGAANYLLKPFSLPQLDVAIRQIVEKRTLRTENAYLKQRLEEEQHASGELLFRAPEMAHVWNLVKRVAPTDATVMIQGESGTGKELIARAIHENSSRKDGPYIKVNCAAVPENLLESEFFGHEKGSFTGATQRREGRFELANGGTILLDEVTEISLSLQTKLLRALQEREFERVGGNRTIKVDVRVLATSNRDLLKAVERGEFRQDLFFRLNVVPIKVPPLRERTGEVEFLINKFVERFSRKYGKDTVQISPLALDQLSRYPWPGNVRELQNCAERAVILGGDGGELEFPDFLPVPPAPEGSVDSALDTTAGFPTVAEMERRLILLALKKTRGNRNEAARLLDINVRTLRMKLRQYEGASVPAEAGGAGGSEQEVAS